MLVVPFDCSSTNAPYDVMSEEADRNKNIKIRVLCGPSHKTAHDPKEVIYLKWPYTCIKRRATCKEKGGGGLKRCILQTK